MGVAQSKDFVVLSIELERTGADKGFYSAVIDALNENALKVLNTKSELFFTN